MSFIVYDDLGTALIPVWSMLKQWNFLHLSQFFRYPVYVDLLKIETFLIVIFADEFSFPLANTILLRYEFVNILVISIITMTISTMLFYNGFVAAKLQRKYKSHTVWI